jgi:hypothetical protein
MTAPLFPIRIRKLVDVSELEHRSMSRTRVGLVGTNGRSGRNRTAIAFCATAIFTAALGGGGSTPARALRDAIRRLFFISDRLSRAPTTGGHCWVVGESHQWRLDCFGLISLATTTQGILKYVSEYVFSASFSVYIGFKVELEIPITHNPEGLSL